MRTALRQLGAAARIGWETESNWTRLWVFLLYSAARPLSLCLILYFLFRVSTPAPSQAPVFVASYLGSAFFTLVIAITASLSWVIIEDREHYQRIRYVYITPMRLFVYIFGRSLPILAISLSSLLIVLAFGRVVLGLPIGPGAMRWPLFLPTFLLGLATTAALGILFAGVILITARHSMLLAEGSGATFLLVCGVIYPVDLMPAGVVWFSKVLPMTYWMELVRRSYGITGFSPALAHFSDGALLAIFGVSTVLLALLAVWAFRRFEHLAKRWGKLDQATNY